MQRAGAGRWRRFRRVGRGVVDRLGSKDRISVDELLSKHSKLRRNTKKTNLVQPVGERVFSARRGPDNPPVIDDELVPTWSGLALRYSLECADDFDGGLERQRQRFIRLRHSARKDSLEVPSPIAHDDKDNVLLLAQAVYPPKDANAFRSQ